MRFRRGQPGEARPASHLEFRYSTIALCGQNDGSSGRESDLRRSAVPGNITPSAGDTTMFANQDPIRPVTIVDGSRLVADVSIDFGEALAVVQVTGDPRGAQVYSDQFAEIIQSDASVRARLEVQGGRLVVAGGSEAGGVSYDATVYESDKHGT